MILPQPSLKPRRFEHTLFLTTSPSRCPHQVCPPLTLSTPYHTEFLRTLIFSGPFTPDLRTLIIQGPHTTPLKMVCPSNRVSHVPRTAELRLIQDTDARAGRLTLEQDVASVFTTVFTPQCSSNPCCEARPRASACPRGSPRPTPERCLSNYLLHLMVLTTELNGVYYSIQWC